MIDGTRTETRTSPARDFRGFGKVPARQRATSRSNCTRIRPIRPHTATSSAVKRRSRAATTAIAACRSERRVEKLSMIKSNILRDRCQDFIPRKIIWLRATVPEAAVPRPKRTDDGLTKYQRYRQTQMHRGMKELRIWVPDPNRPEFAATDWPEP